MQAHDFAAEFAQKHEELIKLAKQANKEDRENAALFEQMLKTPAWAAYVKSLSTRMQAFSDQLLKPGGSVDGLIAQEWIKGALSGLVMARDLPSVTIQVAKELPKPGDEE